jgi:hypothetical protein
MPNRQLDPTLVYADPHGNVFSPKSSTDPGNNLGVNMCMNILEGDNSPRVNDNPIKDVSQRLQNMKIYVSHTRLSNNHYQSIAFRLTVIMMGKSSIIQMMMVNLMKQQVIVH